MGLSIIAFIFVIGIIIFIHELGHFVVAKLSGVGVETFSLGFGPKLISITRGGTEYRISVLPLGGYVKMVGESPEEEVSEAEREKSFTHKPLSKRVAIVMAGSVMNVVLALVLFPVIYMIGIQAPAYMGKVPEVGSVKEGTPASEAGIREGDIIAAVDGKEMEDWEDLGMILSLSPAQPLKLMVRRGEESFEVTIVPGVSEETGAGLSGFYPPARPAVGIVTKGGPADRAGLKTGDVIAAVNGEPLKRAGQIQEIVGTSGEERSFLVERDGEAFTVNIAPEFNEGAKLFLIGITIQEESVLRSYGFIDSIKLGLDKTLEMAVLLFVVLKGLFSGVYSAKSVGGPIMIAQMSGMAAETGVASLLTLVALLSLHIGLINLFPIPVLDGGYLVFFAIEFLRGKPLSDRVMGMTQQVGFAMLITLMVFVTYNDLDRVLDISRFFR
ncbi:MAG: RIP metalloprotease RseP [Thermodesulfobacteriota bacterium]